MQDDHPGSDELGRRLEAYASVRLAPRRGSMARIRTALIEEARMQHLDASMAQVRRRGTLRRRGTALLLAACLTVAAVAGVAAASTAGGPLYGARLWVESINLPTDANGRALERIQQIDARILDVEQAVQSGDQNAVAAAVAAYRDAVNAAVADAGTDANRLAHLKAALGLHVVVLQTLSGELPGPAVLAIDGAIQSSQKAVDRIDRVKTNNGKGGPDATAAPADEPGATLTPKPGKTGQPGGNGAAPTDQPTPPAPDPTPDHTAGH